MKLPWYNFINIKYFWTTNIVHIYVIYMYIYNVCHIYYYIFFAYNIISGWLNILSTMQFLNWQSNNEVTGETLFQVTVRKELYI